MDVQLSVEESSALRAALQTYLSDLRMEITDTDNPGYRRDLQGERAALEGVLAKLEQAAAAPGDVDGAGRAVVRIVTVWAD